MSKPAETLRAIQNFDQLIRYLEDELGWPLQEYGFDELTFEYSPEELGIKEQDAAKITRIHQLRPLYTGQPWGIFFVEFETKKLPVVVLRRILSHLVLKKRASSATAAAWNTEDLLFISAFGEIASSQREIAFAHFHQEPGDLPSLRVLGWDAADTPLKLDHLDKTLRERLRWPDDEADQTAWREQWSRPFRHRIGHVIRTADNLAEVLAELARTIRDRAQTMLAAEADNGPLRVLHKAFKTALIHDLSEDSFADTYAQTITYGLLTAAISKTDRSEGRHGTALIADNITDMVPVTNPFLKEMLQTFLHVGGRKGGIDFDELGIQDVVELLRGEETDLPAILDDFGKKKRDEDPVIHFYEHFLSAYNKKLKIQRGVFYTPQPVVSYIVRSVHELLQTGFGLEDGLASTVTWGEMAAKLVIPAGMPESSHRDVNLPANNKPQINTGAVGVLPSMALDSGTPCRNDVHPNTFKIPEGTSPDSPFVVILDPATGTATFLVEVIDIVHKTLTDKWRKQGMKDKQRETAWNEYVPKHLLPRLYGYELMMAPYAIAHMKIGLKLHETGYHFGSEERARIYLTNALEPASDGKGQMEIEELAPALAHEAKAVNAVKQGQRFTVVVGNPPYSPSISEPEWLLKKLDDWKQGLNEKKSDLNREEWKFLRLAQDYCMMAGNGIIGVIINRDFLDGIVKRGMREHLGQTFPVRIAVDLNGDVKGNISDENVFDIEQGVAITILSTRGKKPCLQFTSRIGTRTQKNADLVAKEPIDCVLKEVEVLAPYFRWIPYVSEQSATIEAEYYRWTQIKSAFGIASSGIQTKRDSLCIAFTREEMWEQVQRFHYLPAEQAREEFDLGADGRDWIVTAAKNDIAASGPDKSFIFPILYRPFDIRFSYWTGKTKGFLAYPRREVMQHIVGHKNVGLIFNRQIVGSSVSHFGVARIPICHGTFYLGNKGQDYFAPLFAFDNDLLTIDTSGRSNFTVSFVDNLIKVAGSDALQLTPVDIFYYLYGVFHSPDYRSRYLEFLKIDFPRLPLAGDIYLFRKLSKLGGELVSLHLLESPKLNQFITEYQGEGDNGIPKKPVYKDGAVWINTNQRFENVPEPVWNFHIGGYQVCEKWLKDRKGRRLNTEDIAHYQKIVVALNETIRLMGEIDETIDQHGGWPGAFHTNTPAGQP